MKQEKEILEEVKRFFGRILEVKIAENGYKYASYKQEWLNRIGLKEKDRPEKKASRITKELQANLRCKFGARVKIEASVAEGMTLRFKAIDGGEGIEIDSSKLQAFDVLDLETGTAFEISLSDAFAEFFKDVLKALLDSRVKKLYLCMRNHYYKKAPKSGFIKVASSPMVHQYISLARLYKLEIILIDLLPACNE